MNQISSQPSSSEAGSAFRPLNRVFPIVVLPFMLLIRTVPYLIENAPGWIWMVPSFGPALLGLLILGWWIGFSRARWYERIVGFVGVIAILILSQAFGHESLRGGPLLIVMTLPLAIAGFAVGTFLFGKQLTGMRTVKALGIAAAAASASLMVRSDGAWGDFSFGLQPRWQKSPEEQFLESHIAKSDPSNSTQLVLDQVHWPKFRGANQDSVQYGCKLPEDMQANPPKELWRVAVGPAWSSFVAAGEYLFTQEQRGEIEAVVCYNGKTGEEVWESGISSRFFEGLGGLGPRSTPALDGNYLYTLGAEGWLRKLDARNGQLLWKTDLRAEASMSAPPMWGFSASPLVDAGKVIVHAGGSGDKGVIALSCETGKLVWSTASGKDSYGSVQAIDLLGKRYLCLLSEQGAHLWDPETGKLVYDYQWPHAGYRSLQPQVVDGSKLLVGTGMGTGTRLVQFMEADGGLAAEELWTSLNMKSDFNDYLVHKGHLYGFDNRIFACIDLETGKQKWKGGRYEKGQALLLADSDQIVVVSEKGELVFLKASPEKLQETYKVQALDEKTWNHPIVVGDKLYLRNAKEAVCYQLPMQVPN